MIGVRINGKDGLSIGVADRGLSYGDGIFETILLVDGKLHFLQAHFQRMKHGCDVLDIRLPEEKWWLNEITQLTGQQKNAVIKLIVTRGEGGRGYLTSPDQQPTCIISLYALPADLDRKHEGITCGIAQHPLVINPTLAGVKHLNRLDQVIARNEWKNKEIDEVLMCDLEGNLVEGSSSNLFLVKNKTLITSPTKRCAVAGVVRQAVIEWAKKHSINTSRETVSASDLQNIEEVFVCNSIWGVVPVLRLLNHQNDVLFTSKKGEVTELMQKKFLDSNREYDATVV